MAQTFTCSNCGEHQMIKEVTSLSGEKEKRLSKAKTFHMKVLECKSCGHLQFFDEYFVKS